MPASISLLLHLLTFCAAMAFTVHMGGQTAASPPRIVEIDSEAALRRFASSLGDAAPEQIADQTEGFIRAMQSTLDEIASQNDVIIVDTRLTLAGAQDISAQAYASAVAAEFAARGDGPAQAPQSAPELPEVSR